MASKVKKWEKTTKLWDGMCQGFPDVRHINIVQGRKCNGQLTIGGEVTFRVPTGFGFIGRKFTVTRKQVKCYSGFCLKCGKEGVFARAAKGANRDVH